ncbi:Diacylglycerol kinase [bioreactor metagenome]|uniref:Diacylglycerol kinase n=1 Tax=bioreactor metagenome TaxID=1076179 RepID=A0A644XFH4_9ZZZZ
MRHIFIINPVAGKGRSQSEIASNINSLLQNKEIQYEIYYTRYKGDAKSFVDSKCTDKSPVVFYACGGDGTLHEVINAAVSYSHASVGVIPCGSGNDFVKNFNNHYLFGDIAAQVSGETVKLDMIKAQNEYAASVCNIGFDADAAFNMHKFKKIPFITGSGCYILSVLYCLLKKLGKKLKVVLDDDYTFEGTFLLGVAANGHSYGGGYKCAPKALINDGVIDVCFVNKMSRFKILGLIGSYKNGTHLENEKLKDYITYKKCKTVKIISQESINLCVDGENYVFEEIDFEIVPESLNFRLPKGVTVQGSKPQKAQ